MCYGSRSPARWVSFLGRQTTGATRYEIRPEFYTAKKY
ncbi:hypothetical protein VPHK391_0100 [Vibrio phage K391]